MRWILEAPESLLSQQATLQRQDLLGRYGGYAKLSAQAAAIRSELEKLPLASDKPEDIKKQTQLFEQLAQASAAQELMLQVHRLAAGTVGVRVSAVADRQGDSTEPDR